MEHDFYKKFTKYLKVVNNRNRNKIYTQSKFTLNLHIICRKKVLFGHDIWDRITKLLDPRFGKTLVLVRHRV